MSLVPLDPEQSVTSRWLALFHSSEGLVGKAHQTTVAQALTDAQLKPASVQHLSADDYILLSQRICRAALPTDDLFANLAFSRYKVVFQGLRTSPEGGKTYWHPRRVLLLKLTCIVFQHVLLVQASALESLQ